MNPKANTFAKLSSSQTLFLNNVTRLRFSRLRNGFANSNLRSRLQSAEHRKLRCARLRNKQAETTLRAFLRFGSSFAIDNIQFKKRRGGESSSYGRCREWRRIRGC